MALFTNMNFLHCLFLHIITTSRLHSLFTKKLYKNCSPGRGETICRAMLFIWSRWGDSNSQCISVALEERSDIQFRAHRDYWGCLIQHEDSEDLFPAAEQSCTALFSHTLRNTQSGQKPFVILLILLWMTKTWGCRKRPLTDDISVPWSNTHSLEPTSGELHPNGGDGTGQRQSWHALFLQELQLHGHTSPDRREGESACWWSGSCVQLT